MFVSMKKKNTKNLKDLELTILRSLNRDLAHLNEEQNYTVNAFRSVSWLLIVVWREFSPTNKKQLRKVQLKRLAN